MNEIRKAAVNCEAVKLALSQDKTGFILRLSLHPSDVPDKLLRDAVGTRYMVALVELDAEDQPVMPAHVAEGEEAVRRAGMLARHPKFQQWFFEAGYAEDISEEATIAGLHQVLGIKSRAELKDNRDARDALIDLVRRFERDMGGAGRG